MLQTKKTVCKGPVARKRDPFENQKIPNETGVQRNREQNGKGSGKIEWIRICGSWKGFLSPSWEQ